MSSKSLLPPQLQRLLSRLQRHLDPPENEYRLTGFLFLRCLGFVYTIAFLGLALQLEPLIGRQGLLPAHLDLERLAVNGWQALAQAPTLMWIDSGDTFMSILAWVGLGLSIALLLGFASTAHLLGLWILYTSFVNVGQLFYGYGWEILLLESGFLAIFISPNLLPGLRPARPSPCPKAVIWLLRWTLFRVMFGAGLIKLRGDPCWTELTCLVYHYETQPIPNPLSWYLHQLPALAHALATFFNHLVEIAAVWLIFCPRPVRLVGGGLLVSFQLLLIASGNLSWLNYLTLTLCVACFDDAALLACRRRLSSWRRPPVRSPDLTPIATNGLAAPHRIAVYCLLGVVAILSVAPVVNMLSAQQVMNTSYDRFHLVNTYGAFGSVGRVRREVVIQGTTDERISSTTQWREYEFKCKPGDVNRRPCVVSPYHYRLDWQIWFAAMSDYRRQPWLVHMAYKLLVADAAVIELLDGDPFDGQRPTFVRAELFEYEFTELGDASGAWWKRRHLGNYLPAVSADDPALLNVLRSFGWPVEEPPMRREDGRSTFLYSPAPAQLDACAPCG